TNEIFGHDRTRETQCKMKNEDRMKNEKCKMKNGRLGAMERLRAALVAFCIVHFTFFISAHAGIGPQNVAVVVNSESWASLAIANEYVRLRSIPACNVIYLDG